MLDLRLFRIPTFTGAQIVAFSLHASMFSMFLYITLYMQNVLGYSPLEARPALPAGVGPLLRRRARRRASSSERYPVRAVPDRRPCADRPRPAARCTASRPSDDWTTLLPGFILAGIGIGFVNPPLATAAIGVVEPRRSGAASGINSTFQAGRHGGRASPASARSSSRSSATASVPGASAGRAGGESPSSTRSTTSSSWPPPWRSRARPARPSLIRRRDFVGAAA